MWGVARRRLGAGVRAALPRTFPSPLPGPLGKARREMALPLPLPLPFLPGSCPQASLPPGLPPRYPSAGLVPRPAPVPLSRVGGGPPAAALATAAPKKKGSKVEPTASGPQVPLETRESTVVGGNLHKEGTDPKVLPDEEYPAWLWTLLDKKPPLSELKRKRLEDMPMEELERLVKLDNREKIKALNTQRAKA